MGSSRDLKLRSVVSSSSSRSVPKSEALSPSGLNLVVNSLFWGTAPVHLDPHHHGKWLYSFVESNQSKLNSFLIVIEDALTGVL